MKIAIIGAGFTGLTAAYHLQKQGHQTTILEKNTFLGGLAGGMKNFVSDPPPWEWDLEQFYHHWFTNDHFVFDLGKEIGVAEKFITKRPTSSILYENKIYPFDSPLNILTFPHLPWADKIKTGLTFAQLKYLYNESTSKKFENITAHEYLSKAVGAKSYASLWEPLLIGKFGDYYKEIGMRWFWARIYKRTPSLSYYQGGFGEFAKDIAMAINKLGGEILLGTAVGQINRRGDQLINVNYQHDGQSITTEFDRVIVTTPPISLKFLVPDLPDNYVEKISDSRGLGAMVIVLGLHHPLMRNNYWLNVNDRDWPFLAVVEHTNFMDKSHYNNEHVVYIGDYLSPDHPHMSTDIDDLIDKFTPYLKRINPLFSEESLIRKYLFKANYAQPIIGINHEEKILPMETPVPGVFLASMAQVYPWDRGTNYAIELGEKAAHKILDQPRQ
jgi:protoporphyrinogen oxidase